MDDNRGVAASDGAMLWFAGVFAARYARLFLSIYSFYKYEIAKPIDGAKFSAKDVTVMIPTVSCSDADNEDFKKCNATCLINLPAEVIVITDNAERAMEAEKAIQDVRQGIENGVHNWHDPTAKPKKDTTKDENDSPAPVDLSGVKTKVWSSGIACKRR